MKQRELCKRIKILILFMLIVWCCGANAIGVNAAISNEWESDICDERINKLAYGNEKFIGITDEGYAVISDDGYEWIKGTYIGEVSNLVFCGSYFFVSTYDSGCYLSTNGANWKGVSIGENGEGFDDICYYAGTYYAFINEMVYGGAGYNKGLVCYIYTSTDGVQWKCQMMERGTTGARI